MDLMLFPQYEFADLKDVYGNFSHPSIMVLMGGKNIDKNGFAVIGAEISISAGFEASVCTLSIANVFDMVDSKFKYNSIMDFFCLGTMGEVHVGYDRVVRTVFKGYVSQMRFSYQENGIPLLIVTLMDLKGLMMSTRYNQHVEGKEYSAAIKEIFNKANVQQLTSIYNLKICDTPDKKPEIPGVPPGQEEETAYTVEMVDESDYEFVVRAAKRFNYEFFCVGEDVVFRKARDGANLLIMVGPEFLISDFNVEYNISGLVKNIEVRGVDPDKGEVIIGKRKIKHKISNKKKADSLIGGSQYILHDSTITSDKDAEQRLDYLENEFSNRFARLMIEHIGIPEMTPGRFIIVDKLTRSFSEKFYLTNVTHVFDSELGYKTRIEGVAPTVSSWS